MNKEQNKKYFLTEEYRLHQKNIYIPLYIVGYGKCDVDKIFNFLSEKEFSPFADIVTKSFYNNRDYHTYIRRFQKLGTRVSYSKDCKDEQKTI